MWDFRSLNPMSPNWFFDNENDSLGDIGTEKPREILVCVR